MKWFKHMTTNLDDPFIQELLFKFGAPGYLAYFGTVSLICRENKAYEITGKASFSERYLKQKLHISSTKLQQIFGFCQGKGELFFNFHEKNFEFDFPKVMEIKDNYTKNLQATSNKVSLEVEVEVEEEEETSIARKFFLNLWNPLPPDMKKGKERAWDSFKNQVGTENDYENIQKALKHYLDQVMFFRANGHPQRQYQHGSTWFNENWKDYIDSSVSQGVPSSKKKSTMEQAYEGKGPFVDQIKEMWSLLDAKHPDSSPEFISEAILQTIKGNDFHAALKVIRDMQGIENRND